MRFDLEFWMMQAFWIIAVWLFFSYRQGVRNRWWLAQYSVAILMDDEWRDQERTKLRDVISTSSARDQRTLFQQVGMHVLDSAYKSRGLTTTYVATVAWQVKNG
jgi:hypothetical protein